MTDKATFEEEAMPHRNDLLRVALRLTRNRADAEDLVQDTWMRALGAWSGYRPGSNCRAWLLRILTNSFINGYRRRRRHARACDASRSDALRALYGDGSDRTEPAQARLWQDDLGDEVRAALAELGDDQRAIVELADLDGQRYREIADRLDLPMGTVMSRLFRARRRLEERLRDYACADYGIARAALAC